MQWKSNRKFLISNFQQWLRLLILRVTTWKFTNFMSLILMTIIININLWISRSQISSKCDGFKNFLGPIFKWFTIKRREMQLLMSYRVLLKEVWVRTRNLAPKILNSSSIIILRDQSRLSITKFRKPSYGEVKQSNCLPLYRIPICTRNVVPGPCQYWEELRGELSDKRSYLSTIEDMRIRLLEQQAKDKREQRIMQKCLERSG